VRNIEWTSSLVLLHFYLWQVVLFQLCTVHLLLFRTMTNKYTIISQISHSYMFRHYRVILSELVINTLPSYTSVPNAAVGNTVYN
jgi:hypothetical protein